MRNVLFWNWALKGWSSKKLHVYFNWFNNLKMFLFCPKIFMEVGLWPWGFAKSSSIAAYLAMLALQFWPGWWSMISHLEWASCKHRRKCRTAGPRSSWACPQSVSCEAVCAPISRLVSSDTNAGRWLLFTEPCAERPNSTICPVWKTQTERALFWVNTMHMLAQNRLKINIVWAGGRGGGV